MFSLNPFAYKQALIEGEQVLHEEDTLTGEGAAISRSWIKFKLDRQGCTNGGDGHTRPRASNLLGLLREHSPLRQGKSTLLLCQLFQRLLQPKDQVLGHSVVAGNIFNLSVWITEGKSRRNVPNCTEGNRSRAGVANLRVVLRRAFLHFSIRRASKSISHVDARS